MIALRDSKEIERVIPQRRNGRDGFITVWRDRTRPRVWQPIRVFGI